MRHRYRKHHKMLLEICAQHRTKLGLTIKDWSVMSEFEQIRWVIRTMADRCSTKNSELMWTQTRSLYLQALSSSNPLGQALFKRMGNPRPGDLVYESSRQHVDGRGRLLLVRDEQVQYQVHSYTDKFHYIETQSGELKWWSNCSFVAVPEKQILVLKDLEWTNNFDLEGALRRHKLC